MSKVTLMIMMMIWGSGYVLLLCETLDCCCQQATRLSNISFDEQFSQASASTHSNRQTSSFFVAQRFSRCLFSCCVAAKKCATAWGKTHVSWDAPANPHRLLEFMISCAQGRTFFFRQKNVGDWVQRVASLHLRRVQLAVPRFCGDLNVGKMCVSLRRRAYFWYLSFECLVALPGLFCFVLLLWVYVCSCPLEPECPDVYIYRKHLPR